MTIRLLLVHNLGFSLIGQETKGYFELSHVSSGPKKSKLMNSIMACDEASEESVLLSALNASLAHFVHKTLKDEQVECIRRIVCHGRDVLAVLPTGFGKSAIYQLIPKCC